MGRLVEVHVPELDHTRQGQQGNGRRSDLRQLNVIEGEGADNDGHRKGDQQNRDNRHQQVPEFIVNGAVDLDPDGNEEHRNGGGLGDQHDRFPPSVHRRASAMLAKRLLELLEDAPGGDPVQDGNHDPKHRRNNLLPRILDHIIDGTAGKQQGFEDEDSAEQLHPTPGRRYLFPDGRQGIPRTLHAAGGSIHRAFHPAGGKCGHGPKLRAARSALRDAARQLRRMGPAGDPHTLKSRTGDTG